MAKYEIIDHFDVWGNETDGYTVNDSINTHIRVEIADTDNDTDIIQKLIDVGYLHDNAITHDYIINGDDYLITIDIDDLPYCNLVKLDD